LKPKVVIAGPGAGKTHEMVSRVTEALPLLNRTRILAVITFTKSATASIKSRLLEKHRIPPNVFVGTNYSFFCQYIIQPFASIYRPDINCEKVFLEIDVSKIVSSTSNIKNKNYAAINKARSNILRKLLTEGHIPLSEIGHISYTILEKNNLLRKHLSNRLQFLFIDEFQDVDSWQFKIFDEIRKAKKTRILAVGDPEQYIMGFTYRNTTARKPSFSNIPINKFVSKSEKVILIKNYRSFTEIVNFLNYFHTEINQVSEKGTCKDSGVYFIENQDMNVIIQKYNDLISKTIWHNTESHPVFFYLAYKNKIYEDLSSKYGLEPISEGYKNVRNPLHISLELITTITGCSQRQIQERYELSQLKYRRLGVLLLESIEKKEVHNYESLLEFFTQELGLEIENDLNANYRDPLRSLLQANSYTHTAKKSHIFSSIHKAKGLEADGVLVVAGNENELNAWLSTDKKTRYEDKGDRCRIGYVAFSRAKQVLCIASKKKISIELKKKIEDLGVQII